MNYTDFYILYNGDPNFTPNQLIEDEVIRVIIQKYQLILFSAKGDMLGDPNFGADLLVLLYQTKVSANNVKKILNEQIKTYVPELLIGNYQLDVIFTQAPYNYQDIMYIKMAFSNVEIYAQIGS